MAAPTPTTTVSSRVLRLAAASIDLALIGVPTAMATFGSLGVFASRFARLGFQQSASTGLALAASGVLGTVLFALGTAGCAIVAVWQLVSLSLSGQSVGKAKLGLVIVGPAGARAGFVRAWLLRQFLFGAVLSAPLYFVVFVTDSNTLAYLVSIAMLGVLGWSALLVLGPEKRAAWDRFAGTRVVDTTEVYRPGPVLMGGGVVVAGGALAFAGITLAPVVRDLWPNVPPSSSAAPSAPSSPSEPPMSHGAPAPTDAGAAAVALDAGVVPTSTPSVPAGTSVVPIGTADAGSAAPPARAWAYVDDGGAVHVVADRDAVPPKYRARAHPM